MDTHVMDTPDTESRKTGRMRELTIVNAAELAMAYAQAHYAVVLDGDALAMRVGERAVDVEAYWPQPRYGFITAWNPASMPHSDAANETANALLVARVDAMGLARQPAHAYDARGGWREAGWLVGNIERAMLELLGREFGQAGVLAWEAGEPVRLRMLMPRPGNAASVEHIDWVAPSNGTCLRPIA
jgi:spermidine/putrescine-binding protein